ncbi:MAG: GNAT family N-acetyltransferase [Patulibacter minatonensis]
MSAVVRRLGAGDRAAWQPLWEAYLEFYGAPQVAAGSDDVFSRLVAGADRMVGFVAEQDGRIVGFTHAMLHASTWHAGPACYLEDLFVAPDARGGGVGRALIDAVTDWARKAGAPGVHWITQTENAAARRLYDALAELQPFVRYERPTG